MSHGDDNQAATSLAEVVRETAPSPAADFAERVSWLLDVGESCDALNGREVAEIATATAAVLGIDHGLVLRTFMLVLRTPPRPTGRSRLHVAA